MITFLLIALVVFGTFNVCAYAALVRIHPRRRTWVRVFVVAGNLLWPFFPLIRDMTAASRVIRAVLGPVWFGWTVFTILYTAFVVLVVIAWLPFRRPRFTEFARWPSRILLSALLVGFIVGYYQAIVPLRVERAVIRVPGLPAAAAGTKIALLGDLHVGYFTRVSRLKQIFRTSAGLHPDMVVIAGDLIDDDPWFVPKLLGGASAVPPAIPLYAVLGNHEMYGDPYAAIERLRGSRIRLLVNEGVPFRGLWLAGVSDPAAGQREHTRLLPDLGKALAGRPSSSTPVVFAHQPRILDEARKRGVPVVLCAHTHGGQLGIRPLGWSLAGVFLKYHMGLYNVPPTQMYINTGTGYWLFPFRLGMTPEITLIELQPRDEKPSAQSL